MGSEVTSIHPTPQVKLVLEDANHHRMLRLLTHALSYPGVRACGEDDRQLELASWEGLTVLERAVKSAEDMMCHSAEVGFGWDEGEVARVACDSACRGGDQCEYTGWGSVAVRSSQRAFHCYI